MSELVSTTPHALRLLYGWSALALVGAGAVLIGVGVSRAADVPLEACARAVEPDGCGLERSFDTAALAGTALVAGGGAQGSSALLLPDNTVTWLPPVLGLIAGSVTVALGFVLE